MLENFEWIAEKSALSVRFPLQRYYSILWNETVEVDCPFSKIYLTSESHRYMNIEHAVPRPRIGVIATILHGDDFLRVIPPLSRTS